MSEFPTPAPQESGMPPQPLTNHPFQPINESGVSSDQGCPGHMEGGVEVLNCPKAYSGEKV